MREVFVVHRVVAGEGGGLTTPVRAFDNIEAAKACSEEVQRETLALLDAKLFMPSGPGEIADTGISLRQLLNSFGITRIGHTVLPIEVSGANLHLVKPNLIIA
jgi:hypothetical protein